ncbi:MAG: NAD-dependent protein deacylase 2 [Candidatus Methanolliviera sp. GoM_oil]|nr:MAG: NAD-dependent protein deacylase 2 [Candidatus Methanolliviera sp. GoM_oil]
MRSKIEVENNIRRVAELISESGLTISLSGAGMSTESGIPDFRSPGTGIWEKIDPVKFGSINSFLAGFDLKEIMKLAEGMDISKIFTAEPNEGHKALAELEEMGKLECIVTQNIDMLHHRAGNRNVIEIHGSIRTSSCMYCGKKMEFEEFLAKAMEQQRIPPICECGGIIKPDVVFFGEMLPQDALSRSMEYARKCDLFLSVGSSLVVYPVANLPPLAKKSGAKLVIINMQRTPYDGIADVVIHEKAGEVLPKIVAEVKRMV